VPQVKTAAVTDPLVISALAAVPRELFVPEAQRPFAYMDEDLVVGKGRCVMEPAVLARLLQLADVQPGDRALVVAPAGTGYSAAVLAQMTGTVVAVDSDPVLVAHARQACAQIRAGVSIIADDPKTGCAELPPFDIILIDGAVSEIPRLLRNASRMAGVSWPLFRQGTVGRATVVTRVGEVFSRRQGFDAMIPLLPEFAPAPKFVF